MSGVKNEYYLSNEMRKSAFKFELNYTSVVNNFSKN